MEEVRNEIKLITGMIFLSIDAELASITLAASAVLAPLITLAASTALTSLTTLFSELSELHKLLNSLNFHQHQHEHPMMTLDTNLKKKSNTEERNLKT